MAKAKKLPPDWEMVRFGDVVRNANEAERNPLKAGLERYVGLEHIEPENLHIKEWGLIENGTSFTKKFNKGQVLFGKRRAYQRKVAVTEWNGLCSGDILTFEPSNDDLIPELLPFIVQSEGFFEHALGTSAGSLSPRTRWTQLREYKFPLPPKKEQRQISEKLWLAEKYRNNHEASLDCLTFLKKKLVKEIFSKKISLPKTKTNGWEVIPIGKLFEIHYGKSPKEISVHEGNYPIVGTGGIVGQSGEYLSKQQSIILGRKGTIDQPLLMKTPFWAIDTTFYCVPKIKLNIDCIYYYFQILNWRKYNEASAVPSLSRNTIKQINIPFPTINCQNEIVKFVKKIEKSINMFSQGIENAKSLKTMMINNMTQIT